MCGIITCVPLHAWLVQLVFVTAVSSVVSVHLHVCMALLGGTCMYVLVWHVVYAWLGLVVRAVVLGGFCRHLIPADCLRASPVARFIRRWKGRPPVP